MIKVFLMDIDGVLTDGKVIINSHGEEQKRICFKDIDAFREFKSRGLIIGAITGEKTPITEYIRNRVTWDYFYTGAKDKTAIIEEISQKENVSLEEICYIGDGKYDISPLSCVGLAVCPKDAIDEVKKVSHVVLSRNGGDGCVWELISVLDKYNAGNTFESSLRNTMGNYSNALEQIVLAQNNVERIELLAEKLQDCLHNNGNLLLVGSRELLPVLQYAAVHFKTVFAAERTLTPEVLNIAGSTIFKKLQAKMQPHDVILSFANPRDVNKLTRLIKAASEQGAYAVQILTNNENAKTISCTDIYLEDNNLINVCEIFIILWHFLCAKLKDSLIQDLIGKRRCS